MIGSPPHAPHPAPYSGDGVPAARPKSVLIGSESLLLQCAEMLDRHGHDVIAIVSDRPAITDWAKANGIRSIDTPGALVDAGLGAFDYLFSITNLSVLSPEILALPTRAAINFHDGPLPDYAGLNTPVWALLAGETQHGVTWHVMTAQVDGGAPLVVERFAIDADETALSINTKCFAAGVQSFPALLATLDETLPHETQTPHRYFGRRDRPARAGVIDWSAPAHDIARTVRALDHGNYRNPLGVARTRLGGGAVLVQGAEVTGVASVAPPGTLTIAGGETMVATGTTDLRLTRLATANGEAVDAVAGRFDTPSPAILQALVERDAAAAIHEPWWQARLIASDPLRLPHASADSGTATSTASDLALSGSADALVAAHIAYFARIADKAAFHIGLDDRAPPALRDWFAPQLPLEVRIDWNAGLDSLTAGIQRERAMLARRIGHATDLIARTPELRGTETAYPVAIQIVDAIDDAALPAGSGLVIAIAADGGTCRWLHDASFSAAAIDDLQRGLLAFLNVAQHSPDAAVGAIDVMTADERAQADLWNGAILQTHEADCVHRMFAAQAMRTPDHPAVTARGRSLSYAALDQRSDRLGHHLRTMGIGPGALVGLNVERSVDMLVALIAIHKAGGAYVPLDPDYPADRLAYMIADAGLDVIVTQASLADTLPREDVALVLVDGDWADTPCPEHPCDGGATPDDLAYVIYTSGSTGKPKGVMVEHRNVTNFFAGMDHHLEPDGTWLAVTSLSFDISVLELCWTVARGYHVVIAPAGAIRGEAPGDGAVPPVDFSLFYFASADTGNAADQYRLLLEGAKFADANGFEAVWTPERHFHAFGGLYPNPSVTGAAIAAITSRVKIRGGSVVAPLHHPARIAEEWALVDNLSNGRVGIAFASGWQPNDFVLRPESFADRNAALADTLDTVRALWRGEQRSFPGPLGKDVAIGIYPRPVQPELPFWITSAGNPDTFVAAGRSGAFVLTHLLGQTVAEVGEKLRLYREAWRAAGHPGEGRVTLMLHTLVGQDADAVREIARKPLTEYLRTSVNLVKQHAWSFPAFKRRAGMAEDEIDLATLTPEESDALLDHAFDRYFETSGLFGTPRDCLPLIAQLRAVGVDEIACLIDFGVPAQAVLDHLPSLNTLRQLIAAQASPAAETLPALMARHHVTHLQCTPTLAQMILADPAARPALASLRRMMVGGEAFPAALARELRGIVGGTVMNMYGPTETTIWSATHCLDDSEGPVPLGHPLANQQIHVVDTRGQRVRPGTPGELVIGGDGVVRGYLGRPDLTAQRFGADPFRPGGRLYRTGDMARQRPDGALEFLGRIDHQVKIRGYRIELGEIEAVLAQHASVEQAVVVAREQTAGDARLIAYVIAATPADPAALREHLRAHLPEYMVPADIVPLDAMPQTPNGKVDRNRLPDPGLIRVEIAPEPAEAPADDLQERIAGVWRDVLKLPRVGVRQNFFDLGGHSLLAVQAHRRLAAVVGQPLALTDMFRFPTIEALARHLAQGDVAVLSRRPERTRHSRAEIRRNQVLRVQVRN